MAKFKFKVTENTTIENVEQELGYLKNLNITEIPYNHIKKIVEFLGTEIIASSSGSKVRFRHKYLIGYRHYSDGFFRVDLIHSGQAERRIRKRDFIKYLLPPLTTIIEKKREKGETR